MSDDLIEEINAWIKSYLRSKDLVKIRLANNHRTRHHTFKTQCAMIKQAALTCSTIFNFYFNLSNGECSIQKDGHCIDYCLHFNKIYQTKIRTRIWCGNVFDSFEGLRRHIGWMQARSSHLYFPDNFEEWLGNMQPPPIVEAHPVLLRQALLPVKNEISFVQKILTEHKIDPASIQDKFKEIYELINSNNLTCFGYQQNLETSTTNITTNVEEINNQSLPVENSEENQLSQSIDDLESQIQNNLRHFVMNFSEGLTLWVKVGLYIFFK